MRNIAAALSLLALAACAGMPESEGPLTAFRLTAPGMPDNARLPAKAAGYFAKNPNCTGQNVSPPLAWSNAPDKTRSYAIIWDDQAGRAGLGVSHGVIYGIPAGTNGFAEGALGGRTARSCPARTPSACTGSVRARRKATRRSTT